MARSRPMAATQPFTIRERIVWWRDDLNRAADSEIDSLRYGGVPAPTSKILD